VNRRTVALSIAAAVVAGSTPLVVAPAVAQDAAPDPTVYSFSLPGSVTSGMAKFTLPGDLVTRKAKGDERLGKVPLSVAIAQLVRSKANGRAVGGIVTINGKTREMQGQPHPGDSPHGWLEPGRVMPSRVLRADDCLDAPYAGVRAAPELGAGD
jgi:hypothetical protein